LVSLEDDPWGLGVGDLNGRSYEESLIATSCPPMFPTSTQTYVISKKYERFQAIVGVDDTSKINVPVFFKVIGDGRVLYHRKISMEAPKSIDIPTSGIVRLQLIIDADGATINSAGCHKTLSVWADGKLDVLAAP
jgi:hypothetical protein